MTTPAVPVIKRADDSLFEEASASCQRNGLKPLSNNVLVTIRQVGQDGMRNCTVLHAQLTDAGFDEEDDTVKKISCRLTREAAFFEIEGKFYRMSFGSSFEEREYKEHGYTSLVAIGALEYPSFTPSFREKRYGSFLSHSAFGIREVSYVYKYLKGHSIYAPVSVEGHDGVYLAPTVRELDLHFIGSNVINVSDKYPRSLSSDFEVFHPGVSCVRQIIGVYNEGPRSYIVATTPWDISVTWITYEENIVTA